MGGRTAPAGRRLLAWIEDIELRTVRPRRDFLGCCVATPGYGAAARCGQQCRRGMWRGDDRYGAGHFGADGERGQGGEPGLLLLGSWNVYAGIIVGGEGSPPCRADQAD